jgi:hypothetical protein
MGVAIGADVEPAHLLRAQMRSIPPSYGSLTPPAVAAASPPRGMILHDQPRSAGIAAHRRPAELYLRRLPSVLHCGCKTARGVECQAPSLTINRMGGANVAGRNVTQDPADPDPDLADVLRPPRTGLAPRRGGHQA